MERNHHSTKKLYKLEGGTKLNKNNNIHINGIEDNSRQRKSMLNSPGLNHDLLNSGEFDDAYQTKKEQRRYM